ncbi:MAG: type I restriction enzyme HsdR N-terminal domain-containing protein [Chitinophagaceae bacterium]|nr:type I restriction enzyme HsdR N-terminal domain-containing protein [Chitinophagaceae bacterium]
MVKVEFPKFDFQIKEADGKELIFDEIRKQWVRLTPEEWVRQNFIQYLVQTKNYPASLIGVEKEIQLGELKKRFDLLVFDKNHQPWMMIECKAMEVKLDDDVLQQALRYNQSIPVQYLVITNGSYTVCYEKNESGLKVINELPVF